MSAPSRRDVDSPSLAKASKQSTQCPGTWRRALSTATLVLLLVFFGLLVAVCGVHVARSTAQEALAAALSADARNNAGFAYPLRAIIYDGRRSGPRNWSATADGEQSKLLHAIENAGSRRYVLLLHGLHNSAELWLPAVERWLELVPRDERRSLVFIMPDLLAHGQSPWPSEPLTVQRHVAALDALLQRVVPAGAALHVGGVSLGAALSLELGAHVLRRRQYSVESPGGWRLQSLLLLATPFYASREQALDAGRNHSTFFRWPWLSKFVCGYVLCRQHWMWRHALKPYFHRRYPSLPDVSLDNGLQHSARGVASCAQHCVLEHRLFDAIDTVREHSVPTLLVDGNRDALCRPARPHLARRLAPCAHSLVLENAGHSFIVHRVDEVARNLSAFARAAPKLARNLAASRVPQQSTS